MAGSRERNGCSIHRYDKAAVANEAVPNTRAFPQDPTPSKCGETTAITAGCQRYRLYEIWPMYTIG
jgi:hypothetical protein